MFEFKIWTADFLLTPQYEILLGQLEIRFLGRWLMLSQIGDVYPSSSLTLKSRDVEEVDFYAGYTASASASASASILTDSSDLAENFI